MLFRYGIASGVVVGLLSSCMHSEVEIDMADLDDLTIELVRTRCYGTCPVYAVEIKGDGTATYCGVGFVKEAGERSRKIELSKIIQLVDAFEAANFYALDDEYAATVTDNPTTVLSIVHKGRNKSVVDYVGEQAGMPKVVTELQDAVDEIAGAAEWIGGPSDNKPDGWQACGTKYFYAPTIVEPDFR